MKKKYIFRISLLIWIVWYGNLLNLNAQNVEFSFKSQIKPSIKLNQYNGLSSHKIKAITQDYAGFIWIGTTNGLNRYDGHNLKTYFTEDSTKNLRSNSITCLLHTKDSILWIGTQNGLNKYNIKEDQFIRIQKPGFLKNTDLHIQSLVADSNENIYIGTNKGLFSLKKNQLKLNQIFKEKFSIVNNYFQLFVDKNEILWIASDAEGIFRFELTKSKFSQLNYNTTSGKQITNIQDITSGPDNNIWIATWGNGLWVINPNTEKTRCYTHDPKNINSLNSNNIKSIAFDHNGNLWIGYEEAGLDYFTPEKEKFKHFFSPITETSKFEEPSIYEIFIDQEMIMWVGFRNDGVQAFPLKNNPFNIFTPPQNASSYKVFCMHGLDKKTIALGVKNAIDFLNTKNGSFLKIEMPNKETPVSITEFDKNNLIIATYNDNIYLLNIKNKQFKPFLLKKNNSFLNYLRLIYKAPGKSQILVGSSKGLYKLKPDTPTDTTVIIKNWIHSVQFEDDSVFWATSYVSPIYRTNINSGKSKQYTPNILQDIKASKKIGNHLFIGSDLGFYSFNTNSLSLKKFTNIFPYKNVQINAIEKDDNKGIWCSSFESIIYFDLINEQFRTFDKTDQIMNIRFLDGVSCKLSNGSIAFGGNGGIALLNPNHFQKQRNNAQLKFTELKIQNNTILPSQKDSPLTKNISESKHITLKNHQNTFTLKFSLLSFTNSSKHRFRYKLKGATNNWIDLENQTQITFTNLKRGQYFLQIQAANQDNIWTDINQMSVKILPPFYLSWHALVLYFLLSLLLLFLILKTYKARIKARNEIKTKELKLKNLEDLVAQENEFHHMKLRFFTNISHELKTPISLILAPLEKHILSGSIPPKNEINIMHKNADRLNRLVSQILDFRKIESGKIKLELSKGDIIQFCRQKALLFYPLAHKRNLAYSVKLPKKSYSAWFDKDKLEKIIYNLLSNAFKFTTKGNISFSLNIDLSNSTPIAILSVKDTGKGISDDQAKHLFERFYSYGNLESNNEKSTGIGLSLTKELTEMHHGKISFSPRKEGGSLFSVSIPLNLKPDLDLSGQHQQPVYADNAKRVTEINNNCQNKSANNKTGVQILIVEDNEDLRTFIKNEFKSEYKVLLAANGKEGLETAKKELPDLIISDIQMPVMNGIEMCEKIRNNNITSHIPLIILTAYESFDLKLKGFNSGIDDYITKPFSPQLLFLKVKNLLCRRFELQRKFKRNITLEPKELPIINADEDFLKKAMKIVQENLTDEEFSADAFADKMAMSRVHLYRKLKALTGESVSDFVRTIRLKLAADLLKNKNLTVKETAYSVGFSDPKYFSKCFKQQFGLKPTDYAKSNTGEND